MAISRNKVDLPLILILALAASVRFWGIDFGLPGTLARPDESVLLRIALRFGSGDLNPHFFNYPTLFLYLLFALYAPYYVLGKWLGHFTSSADFVAQSVFEPAPFFLISRSLSALSGLATAYIVYRIAQELFDKTVARASALFLALAFLAVRDSHFGVTDTFAAFLTCCSILYIIKAWKTQTLKHYLLAGTFAGLAASTKYYGFLLVIPLLLAYFLNTTTADDASNARRQSSLRQLSLAVACIPLAFLLGTPYALLDFQKFLTDFRFEQHHLDQGHFGIVVDRGWWHHLTFTLPYGLGWPLLLTSLVGIIVLLRTAPRKTLILCAFPVAYYLFAGKGHTVFVRYMIPVVPFLCITAAVCVVALTHRLRPALQNKMIIILAILLLLPSIRSIVKFNSLLTQTDTRVLAAHWITSHVEPGSSFFQAGSDWTDLSLRPTISSLEEQLAAAQGPKATALKGKIDYLKRNDLPGYQQEKSISQAALPHMIILFDTPFPQDQTHPDVAQLVRNHYRLEKSFLAGDKTNPRNRYDPQDTFYVPYAGFHNIQRPGPNIEIYFLKK